MDSRTELALWTAGSCLLLVAGTWAAWRAQHWPDDWRGRWAANWTANRWGRAALFIIRFAYYVGLPYIALMRGALSLVVMGVVGTQTADLPWWTLGWSLADWAGSIGWMAGLGSLAGVILALGWWNTRRALGGDFAGEMSGAPSLLVTARESLYSEIHWAFYRAAPFLFIADSYWAVLAGAGLVMLEWLLDPAWRAGLGDDARRPVLVMQLAWLALSTSLFALIRNVWPIMLLHVILAWALGQWVALLASQSRAALGEV